MAVTHAAALPVTRWVIRPSDPERAKALAAVLGTTLPMAQVLLQRGLGDATRADRYLRAPLSDLADPGSLRDLPAAAARISEALHRRERIIVYGDYDADGVTATAILVRGLRLLGGSAEFFVPRRRVEGYGLNAEAIARLGGPGLLVAADCGITALAEVEAARTQGLDVVVLDHHEPGPDLPRAFAVVDPKRPDQDGVTPYAACGLAFQLVRAACALAGRPDAPETLLDLAALGTIADVVPLIDDNRLLARHGLLRMADAPSLGVAALLREAGITGAVRPRDVAFALAPRLNAAGRLDDARIAVTLLVTEDPQEAAVIAHHLDQENRRRQEICEQVLSEAVARVEEGGLGEAAALVLDGEGWHPGVIGIVASQLRERYGRPVVMIAVEEGIGKGSARSIEALHLVDTLGACAETLVRYGGHAMAAGLTVEPARIDAFRARFLEEAGRRLRPEDLIPTITVDAEVRLADLTPALAREVERLGPFGAANPEPSFAVRGVRALSTRLVGDGHLRLSLSDGRAFAEAIGFSRGDIAEILAFTAAPLDLVVTVELDRWGEEERASLVVQDLVAPTLDLDAVLADGRLLVERLFERAADYLDGGWRGIETAGAFFTKVVGVTFEGRQDAVRVVRSGQPLRLIREPGNPHDPHAIAVLTEEGTHLGYLSAGLAGRLAPSMDAGSRYAANASQVTGGGDRSYGLNIFIQREEQGLFGEIPLHRAWADLPAEGLADRLGRYLQPGRGLRDAQRRLVLAAVEGRRALAVLGPGRRSLSTAMLAAAALGVRRRPAILVLPLASQVDLAYESLAPRLREVGLRVYRAHGALPLRAQQRLARALAEDRADVVLMSGEAHRRRAFAIPTGSLVVLDAGADERGPETDEPPWLIRVTWQGDDATKSRGAAAAPRPAEEGNAVEVIGDSFIRANLRLVDRRNPPDVLVVARDLSAGGEKTMIFTPDPSEAVDLARALREALPDLRVAYEHAGLPLRVRRVIEQLFTDGKIRVLVATDVLTEATAPGDIRQVVLAGLPVSRTQLCEAAGLAGLDGRAATVILAYRPEDAARREARLDERYPPHATLATLYRALREAAGQGPLVWPSPGLRDRLTALGVGSPATWSGLDMLAEAGVILRESVDGGWRIEMSPDPGRRDLTTSLRHAEGMREREALAEVVGWAFGPASAIVTALARPSSAAR